MAFKRQPNQTPFWKAVHRNRPGQPAKPGASPHPDRPTRKPQPHADSAGQPGDAGAADSTTDPGKSLRPRYGAPGSGPDRPFRPKRPFPPAQEGSRPFVRRPAGVGRPTGPGRPSGPGRPVRATRPAFSASPEDAPNPASAAPTAPPASPSRPASRPPFRPRPAFRKFERPPRPVAAKPPTAEAPRTEPGPETDDGLPTVYLRPGEADRILAGHPWVYEGAILRETRPAADGDVVQVKDHRRRLLGVGFYNSKSRIRVRVLHPDRLEFDEAFFERRLRAALEHRRRHLPDATSFRVVNAEGDLLSGLIVDKYEDLLVVQTSSLGMDRRKALIVGALQKLLQPRAILERNDMGSRKFEGLPDSSGVLAGTITDAELAAFPIRLNGLTYEANLLAGHKTGLYLDQQVNHARVAPLAVGGRVLDAFTFIGGFALPAARAGATSVLGLDQSEEAVGTAGRLATGNGLAAHCRFEAANVFDWMREHAAAPAATVDPAPAPAPDRLFDLVILDPPSFTRNRASVPDALRGYKEIHLRALKLLRPGGVLATFCCSHHVDATMFEAVILESAFDARRPLRRLAVYTQSPDHPVLPAVPETEYLKGFAYETLTV